MRHYEVLNGTGEIRKFDNSFTAWNDCREGSLLDSYIGVRNNGNEAVVFERFQNSWMSKYEVYEAENENDIDIIWNLWNDFTEKYDEEFGDDED